MRKERNTYSINWAHKNKILLKRVRQVSLVVVLLIDVQACDFIKMKRDPATDGTAREVVARAHDTRLYKDELNGIVAKGTSKEDSTSRIEAYVNSWIRKQLLIQEAARNIDINEAEVERKILDYRYSIIAYEYQSFYVKQHLDTLVGLPEIESYYKQNIDNFILKQNIVRATFIKIPKNAPRINKVKELIFSKKEKDERELKTYCLSFSAAYHIADSAWMIFDDLVKGSPMVEIPNKIQFLKANPYYETSDDTYLYFFKVEEYRISDNVSPLEFVKNDIKNIILNKRKVELAKLLEDEVYNEAVNKDEFEIIR